MLKSIALGLSSSAVSVIVGLVSLPITLSCLSKTDLGFWYLLAALGSLQGLLLLGFPAVFARSMSWAHSGATSIPEKGDPTVVQGVPNWPLVLDLIVLQSAVYLGASILLAVSGVGYLAYFVLTNNEVANLRWVYLLLGILFTVNLSTQLFLTRNSNQLIGLGQPGRTFELAIHSRLLAAAIALPMLLLGAGLWSMLVSQFVVTIYSYLFYRRTRISETNRAGLGLQRLPAIVRATGRGLLTQSVQFSAVGIGTFLINNVSSFLVPPLLGLKANAEYGLMKQLLGIISGYVMMPLTLRMNSIIAARVGPKENYRHQVRLTYVWFLMLIVCSLVAFVFLSGPALSVFNKAGLLPEVVVLGLAAVALLLELNHSFFGTLITFSNDVPFVAASLLSGVAIVVATVFGLLLVPEWGLAFVVSVPLVVQLAYNNWKWPTYYLKKYY